MKYRMLSVVLTVILTLGLLSTLSPTRQIQADQLSATSKLSVALQQALNDNGYSSVWSDSSKQTVRTLIQTFGPVSTQLLLAVTAAGGSVVRQFTSINGVLAELPKSSVLSIASRASLLRPTSFQATPTCSALKTCLG